MLEITIPAQTLYNEKTEEFIDTPETKLKLEHSLISISKWEMKYHKPFLGETAKTDAEWRDYVQMMTLTQNVDPLVYMAVTKSNLEAIKAYIDDPMTATVLSNQGSGGNPGKFITNELIYCWMTQQSIPFSCEKWHIQRLLTLINVCVNENKPPKKMDERSVLKQNAALNRARRKPSKPHI